MDSFVERHVLDVAMAPHVDDLGFLRLVDDFSRAVLGAGQPVALDDLVDKGSFVLLAHGAAGKSWALQHLASLERDSRMVDLRGLAVSDARAELMQARHDAQLLFVDHLDEVLQAVPQLPRLMEQATAPDGGPAIRWRFGCRPAAWSDGIGQAIERSLRMESGGSVRQLQLLPLTREAAFELTRDIVDSDALVEALERRRFVFLPSVPRRLVTMAEQLASGEADLTMTELIYAEIDGLLQEWDSVRPRPKSSLARRRAVAGRLAAFSVLGGVPGFRARGSQDGRGVPLEQLPDEPEPALPEERVTVDEYAEALSTALFEAAGGDLVRFSHQQLEEALAAIYVRSRYVTLAQAHQLLRVSRHGVLPGRLAGLAAWLGADDPDLVSHIVRDNPLVFAQAGVELASSALRRDVVSALLAAATRGDLRWTWIGDLSALAHPDLATDLQAVAGSPWQGFYLPWWVARIAAACAVREVVPTLIGWAISDHVAEGARAGVVEAIGTLGTVEEKRHLLPLLEQGVSDEIFGRALGALHPEVLSTAEVIGHLRPMTSEVIGGAYSEFLNNIGDRLAPDDHVLWLDALSGWETSRESWHDRVVHAALVAAWSAAEESAAVLVGMAAFVASAYERDSTLPESHDAPHPWRDGDVEMRRRLAVEVARHESADMYVFLDSGLLTTDDARWLLFELADMPDRAARERLLDSAWRVAWRPDAELADAILAMIDDHYAFEATERLRGECSLDTEQRRRRIEMAQKQREREADRKTAAAARPDVVRQSLADATADVGDWWKLVLQLARTAEERVTGGDNLMYSYDLTARPGWGGLNDDERNTALDLGVAYLDHRTPDPANWRTRTTFSSKDLEAWYGDWAGAYMLTTLAAVDPERLRQLDDDVLSAWWPVLLAAWNFDRDGEASSLPTAVLDVVRSRPQIRSAILDEVVASLAARRASSPDNALPSWWSPVVGLARTWVVETLIESGTDTPLDRQLLEILATSVEAEDTWALLQPMVGDRDHPLHLTAIRLLAGTASGLDQLLARNLSRDELAAACRGTDVDAMAPKQRIELLALVADIQPLAEDPPLTEGWSSPDVSQKLRESRNALVQRLAQLGHVDAIAQLESRRPDSERWYWRSYLVQARQAAADAAEELPSPSEVLQLLGATDARFVRSDRDVADLVLAALDQVQLDLRAGGWKTLWHHGDEPQPQSEDDITDQIARQLDHVITGRVTADRELQVTRPNTRGIGRRVDVTIGVGKQQYRVMIEAKHVHSQELKTAMADQLRDQYLVPAGRRFGIFLVYWTPPAQRPRRGPSHAETATELLEELEELAEQLGPNVTVVPYVLDIAAP